MNGSRVIPATAAESLAFSAARNFAMKSSNSLCNAEEATASFGAAWTKAGARYTRAAASKIPNKTFIFNSAHPTNPIYRVLRELRQGIPGPRSAGRVERSMDKWLIGRVPWALWSCVAGLVVVLRADSSGGNGAVLGFVYLALLGVAFTGFA